MPPSPGPLRSARRYPVPLPAARPRPGVPPHAALGRQPPRRTGTQQCSTVTVVCNLVCRQSRCGSLFRLSTTACRARAARGSSPPAARAPACRSPPARRGRRRVRPALHRSSSTTSLTQQNISSSSTLVTAMPNLHSSNSDTSR